MAAPWTVPVAAALLLSGHWGPGQWGQGERSGLAGQAAAIAALDYVRPVAALGVATSSFVLYAHATQLRLLVVAAPDQARQNIELWPVRRWRIAAESLLKPAGCSVTGMVRSRGVVGGYEVSYACAGGLRPAWPTLRRPG